ncbi:MAG: 50S ribosomal protein L32 [Verrucomicrobiota bacterium]
MPVPKRKVSKMKSRSRKASHRQSPLQLRKDAKSGALHRSHCVDPKSGTYKGRQVITVTAED